jgi:hypothetical protein
MSDEVSLETIAALLAADGLAPTPDEIERIASTYAFMREKGRMFDATIAGKAVGPCWLDAPIVVES